MRRRSLLLPLLLMSVTGTVLAQPVAEVFKSPYCGCCEEWVKHLLRNGFQVVTHDLENVSTARRQMGMPDRLSACHTAKIGGYVVEGHVPAADILKLLKEKPKALGLAVPSMPPGSPGMEGPRSIPYETLLVQADGSTSVFAKH